MKTFNGKLIMIVDDDEGIRFALTKLFSRRGAEVAAFPAGTEALAELGRRTYDLIILDIRLADGESGLELLKKIRRREHEVPILMITGYGTVESAVSAMKEGASDFVLKPIDNDALLEIAVKNLSISSLRTENAYLKEELLSQNYPANRYITRNPELLHQLKKVDRIKDTGATILITGESGTGKEVFARYVHYSSALGSGPFIGLNCAALDENLLSSELFGYEKGAFTGAAERRIGKLELADGGTLFLDEIGDMSPAVQAKLLRVLEERSFERVGGNRTIHTEFRLIAATNRNLEEMMKRGDFREDLYYRIKVVAFELSPLRERPEDIEPLVAYFIAYFAQRYAKPRPAVSPALLNRLQAHSWPGNVRELRNLINQAVLLSENGRLAEGLLAAQAEGCIDPVEADEPEWEAGVSLLDHLDQRQEQYEGELLRRALEVYGGNKSETARKLQITRKTLARKLERYGLE